MKEQKLYATRDIQSLDEEGDYFCKHVYAMTSEKLHKKSDIAAELGQRDMVIDQQAARIADLDSKLDQAIDLLDIQQRSWLLMEWSQLEAKETNSKEGNK